MDIKILGDTNRSFTYEQQQKIISELMKIENKKYEIGKDKTIYVVYN